VFTDIYLYIYIGSYLRKTMLWKHDDVTCVSTIDKIYHIYIYIIYLVCGLNTVQENK